MNFPHHATRHESFLAIPAWRWLTAAALVGTAVGATTWSIRELLPQGGDVAVGLRVAGSPTAPGSTASSSTAETDGARLAAETAAARLLARRFTFSWNEERVLDASLAELGATVDVSSLARDIRAVGRSGDLTARAFAALEARRGHIDIAVHASIPIDTLAAQLDRFKQEHDLPPIAAKLDVAARSATKHTPGRYLDVMGAAALLDRAIELGGSHVAIPAFEIAPTASSDVVANIDTSAVVSHYETRFGEASGRAQNVRRAMSGIDGVVLMPGETVSFNANVGARSTDNGFAPAPEIYKGEIREGIGGGTCQVAGTLHAAAFLGGLDVIERSSHSRPSGYIPMGLDATVVFPTVDLRLRNPYDFPIVIHAQASLGTLVLELLGREKPATVRFETAALGTADYKRKIVEVASLHDGAMVVKQRGIRGVTVRKTRTITRGGKQRVEVTTDTYPPTFEILEVAPGTNLESLPPLPQDARGEGNEAPAPAAGANQASAALTAPAGR